MSSPPELIMQGPAEKAPVEAGTLLGQLKQGLRQVFLESAQSAEAKAKADSESDSKNGGLIEEGLLELANEGSASEADLQAKQFTEEVSLLDKSSDADVAASLAGGTLEGAKPLLDTRPAIANLCSILEQILQHGLRPSISEGSYGLIGGVMAGWRRAPPQQLPPSAWRFLEAVVGPASAQSRGDTSTTGKSTEAASSSSVVEGTRTAAPTGGTGGSSISLSSGGKSAEKLCSYPPLVGGLAQVRAFAGTSTASARLQALLRLGLGCRCLGQWLAEALLSPAAQGVSGKGGLLAQWYDETAFVRSHDSVEALVAAMMALGALHFEGLETRFVEGPGMVTEGCGEGLGLFKESGGAESEVQADGPGGATEGGVSERTGTGARVSESGQSAGQTSVSASGGVLNTGWSTLTSVGTGAASLVLEGGNAASGLWKTVHSTSQNWGNFAGSRVTPHSAAGLNNGPETAYPVDPASLRGVDSGTADGGAHSKDGSSLQATPTSEAVVQGNVVEKLGSDGLETPGSTLTPGQDLSLRIGVSGISPGEKQPGVLQPGSFLPTVANKAATAVAAAASSISEASLKPVFSYPFRRPSSSGGAEATGRPPVTSPPLGSTAQTGAGLFSGRPSSADGAKPVNIADGLETVKPANPAESATRSGFFFPFQRPSSSDGVGDRGNTQPASKPFWRRFSSGSEPTSSGFDELFPEAEFGSNENGGVLEPGLSDEGEKDGLDWLRAGDHVGGFDPGGVSSGINKGIDVRNQGVRREPSVGTGDGAKGPKELSGNQIEAIHRNSTGKQSEIAPGSGKGTFGGRVGPTERRGRGTGNQIGASESRGRASGTQSGPFSGLKANEGSPAPQLTAQTAARPWSDSWAPGSLFSAAGASVKNGVLAPQELLSSVVSKGWPFGTASKSSLPLESSSKPPKVEARSQGQNPGTGLGDPRNGWLGDRIATAKAPPGRVGSEGGEGKAVEGDPQSDASVVVYSSGEDSYQSQVPSPQQLASLLGPGAEVLILDGRSGDEIEIEPGPLGGVDRSGGVKTASSSEDDLESDLGAMLGGGLYQRRQKRLENGGSSFEAGTGLQMMGGGALQLGGSDPADVLPGLPSDVMRGVDLSGDPGDLSFKHFLTQPQVADRSETDATEPSDAVDGSDAGNRLSDGTHVPPGTDRSNGALSAHRTDSDAPVFSGAAKPLDSVRILSESGAPDEGPLVHRTDSDAARGAAAGENVVGVRSPLFRLASDSTTGDASPRAPLDAVSGQLYGPLHLDDGYLDMVTDMEDVLLDTDGGSGLSRASSSFGHVAHPPSSRVPGGGFRRVEVVGVRYVASSPSESARAASERGSFASERARAASGSPVSDGGRKGPQRSPGEVQLRQTSRGFGASGDEVRTEGLESERAGLIPLTNGLTTFQTGAYSPSRQAGFEGVASLQVEVYEDLLRGSEDESEDSPSSRTPSDGLKIDRTLQIETESDLRRFLGTSERSKTDGKDGVVSGEGTSKAGEVPQEQSAATDHELRSRSRSPGGGLLDEVTGSHSRVLVAEGSTAAAAAAAMAARAEVGLPSAVLENSTSEACGSSATGPNVGLQSSRNAGEPGLSERGLGLGSLAEKSSPSDEDLDQHPLVEQTTRASKSNVSSRRFSTDLKVNHDQPLSSKSTLAVPYRQPLEQTLGTVRPAQAPQQSGLIASLGHAAHAFSRPKAYTMYILQTVTRDGRVWTTERRYRDLAALRTQLGRALPGAVLPLPFAHVSAQKRNLFGSTDPEVVDQRKELFETCLSALIELGPPLATAPPLIKFLCGSLEQTGSSLTNNAKPGSGAEEAGEIMSPGLTSGLTSPSTPGSPRSSWGEDAGGASGGGEFGASETGAAVLGSSIRLIVDLPGKRSVSRQLQAQHNACAGCYRPFPPAPALLSWTNPAARLCEYSGQLYCADCHHKDTAILPAYVLQYWDFRPRKVSQIAKAYLDSIYDQPMLCVSAVNPHLYSRVPALARVKELRQRLVKMVTTAVKHCPAKRRLLAPVGSRRYLLETGDFFALRDLVDLSKGAFAVLPEMMQTLTERVSAHVASGCDTCAGVHSGGPGNNSR